MLDTTCHLALQKDSTLDPSYPQISRRPEIIHIYLSVYERVSVHDIEEPEIAVGHFPTKLQFFRSNAKLSGHFSEQKNSNQIS